MHFPFGALLGSLLLIPPTALGDSILVFAPVTALSGQYALEARHIGGACPAATQTSCADGIGCCPSGAACTYSRDLPVCNELCGNGPKCSNGGCCQAGYFCGLTNNFCTPSATGIAKLPTFSSQPNAPLTTPATRTTPVATAEPPSSPSSDPDDPSTFDNSTPGGVAGRPTPPATASSTSTRSNGRGGSRSASSHTPSDTVTRTRTTKSTTSTGTRTRPGSESEDDDTDAVAKTPSRTPHPKSTGAASSLHAGNSLAAILFGWITGLFTIL